MKEPVGSDRSGAFKKQIEVHLQRDGRHSNLPLLENLGMNLPEQPHRSAVDYDRAGPAHEECRVIQRMQLIRAIQIVEQQIEARMQLGEMSLCVGDERADGKEDHGLAARHHVRYSEPRSRGSCRAPVPRRLGAGAGRRRAVELFAWRAIAERTMDVYREVLR